MTIAFWKSINNLKPNFIFISGLGSLTFISFISFLNPQKMKITSQEYQKSQIPQLIKSNQIKSTIKSSQGKYVRPSFQV